jgi:hypothetical protein
MSNATNGTIAQIRSNANGFPLGSSARACLHHAAEEMAALVAALAKARPALVSRSVVLTSRDETDDDELREVEAAIMAIDEAIERAAPVSQT